MFLPPPITVTDRARARIEYLLAQKSCAGLRVGVKSGGCSGHSYNVDYADSIGPMDEVVSLGRAKLIITPDSLLHLLGTEMDYEETKLKSGFTFKNPNAKGHCGCGKSFHT